jgi:Zn ribbon nucleic-acid-binding protein
LHSKTTLNNFDYFYDCFNLKVSMKRFTAFALLSFMLISVSTALAQPANDNLASATVITHSSNNCSANAAYTTVNATADGLAGSCWENGPNYTVWFTFVATSANVTLDLKVGGAEGTMQHPNMALWLSDGTTQVKCVRRIDATTDVQISSSSLTIGNTYYISVDNYVGLGYRGTFTLCIDNTVTNDEFAGATTLIHSSNNCSANAAYTTVNATADGVAGSCWENGPNYNRWFRFVATTTNVTLDLKVGGAEGTMQHPNMALWLSDGTTQVKCVRRIDATTDVQISSSALTIGNTYYVSVDHYVGLGYRGTFTLCIDNTVTNDEFAGATTLIHSSNNCSANAAYTTVNATADGVAGSCWENGPNYNRWFRFVATTTNVTLDLKVGGAEGTMQHPNMALWLSDGTTQVKCVRRIDATTDVQISSSSLTIGNTYYVSVDNYVGLGYRGTFTLCIDNTVTNDEFAGATTLIHSSNNCSANAAYTTVNATADGLKGSCWENGPNYNRWFKFVATSAYVTLDLKTGGAEGTVQHASMALWEADGITEVKCVRRIDAYTDVQISSSSLTVGNTYYVSVDNYVGLGYRGTFTLCIDNTVTYDEFAGATTLIHSTNNCSANAAYTTVNATADGLKGSCWENGPNYNRWFKFVATSAYVTLDLKTGGAEGTVQHASMALWEADGITEVKCVRRIDAYTDVQISSSTLTIGNTYYVSVDNYVGLGYRGTFTLCIDNTVTYDYVAGAIELTNLNNWCSANAAYTTVNATADGLKGSCWENGPNYTRWFKFTALSNNVTIQMKVGGAEGSLQHPNIALWQADATTQVGCTRRVDATTDISLSSAALVIGNTYYISCDNYVGLGYRGTFTLCIDNVDETYYSRASSAWNDPNTWSTIAIDGAAAADYPKVGDVVYIEGHAITITTNEVAAQVNVDASTINNTDLTISNGSLTVAGQFNVTNPGNNFNLTFTLLNSTLFINDDFNINRNGGTAILSFLTNGTAVTVNRDFNIYSTAGTGDNTLTFGASSSLTINDELRLSNTGGPKTTLTLSGSNAIIDENVTFTASTDNLVEFDLSAGSNLYLRHNIVRGTPAYGILLSSGNSTVHYNSSAYSQTFASSNGSGTGDVITYENVVLNNTHITTPQLTMGGPATINGNLTMTSGIIRTTSSNILNLMNATITSIGSTSCYIDGPLTYEVATSTPTVRNLPIGKGSSYRPAILSVTHTDNVPVVYTVEHFNASAEALGYTLPPTVDLVSNARYWQFDRQAVANLTTASVTLYYGIGTSDGVTDFTNLTVVKNVGAGTTWFDVGGTATGNGSGSITSGPFTTFSIITLGNLIGGSNPLPVELVDFKGRYDGESVVLNWKTVSELNNDYFTIQRSSGDGEFINIKNVQGAGTTQLVTNYEEKDEDPLPGIAYYRLKQTDFDGQTEYSNIISVESKVTPSIELYPNPIEEDVVHIRLIGFDQGEDIKISFQNLLGQTVLEKIIHTEGTSDLLSTVHFAGQLPTGLYFVVSTYKKGKNTSRIIVR